MTSLDAQLVHNKMQRALNLQELRTAHAAGQPTVVQTVEDGHFLEGKLERLEGAYGRRLRVLGLFHDSDATVPLGDLYTAPAHLVLAADRRAAARESEPTRLGRNRSSGSTTRSSVRW